MTASVAPVPVVGNAEAGVSASRPRTPVGKGLRFTIFRRDGFTCQYCGAQPPDVTLHIDHIIPVVEGGSNDEMNLVTACDACNLGKGRKLLDRPQRPDADLAWLETQQEVSELRRYQLAKAERDRIAHELVPVLQATWCDCSGLDWHPVASMVYRNILQYGPDTVERAYIAVAPKVFGGYIRPESKWLPYLYATLRTMALEAAD